MAALKTITLNNGVTMPVLGLGTSLKREKNDQGVINAVKTAVKAGYRLIDTAWAYGTEKAIGEALVQLFSEGVIQRQDIFIVTKLHCQFNHREQVEPMLKASLKNLQLDYVDLYLIHFPIGIKHVTGNLWPEENGKVLYDDAVDYLETWQGMEDVYEKGLCWSIGLSNFSRQQIDRILDNGRIAPMNLQVECNPYWPQIQLQDYCKRKNISITAYAPFGCPGMRTQDMWKEKIDVDDLLDLPQIQQIANKYKKLPSQVLLRWVVQQGMTTIPKSLTDSRIESNAQIFDFDLSLDELSQLAALKQQRSIFHKVFFHRFKDHPHNPFGEFGQL